MEKDICENVGQALKTLKKLQSADGELKALLEATQNLPEKVKAKNIILKTGEYLASVMVNLLGLFLSKILTIIGIVFSVIGLIGIRLIKSISHKMWELVKSIIKVKAF